MKKMISTIFLLVFWASESAAKTLYVGFIERAPHIYANADGSIRGLLGKQLQDIFKRARVDAELVRTFPKDIDTYMGRTDLDAFIATKTLMNDPENYLFSDDPLFVLQFYVYHLSATPKLASLEDLRDTSVVLPISLDSFEGPLKEQITQLANNVSVAFVESNLEQQIVLLRKKRAKYAISYFGPDNVAMMFSKRTNRDDIQTSQIFSLPMFFVMKKSVSGAQELMNRVNIARSSEQ